MDLECPICCSLLTEEPEKPGSTEPVAGPSSRLQTTATPKVCVPSCGHIFHKKCLQDWVRTSNFKSCPTCRKPFTDNQLVTVYLPVVDQVEKKCDSCEMTKKTCEELAAESEEFKELFEEEGRQRNWAEMEVMEIEEMSRKRVEQLIEEKAELNEFVEEEERRRNWAEMEVLESAEMNGRKVNRLIKEKAEMERKLVEEERKVRVLEQMVVEVNRREWDEKMRGDRLHGANLDLQEKFLQERDKVEEKQGSLDELQERHCLLIGDIEEIRKKYEVEQERANVLEGRVKSLQAPRLQQEQSQGSSSSSSEDSSTFFSIQHPTANFF